MQLAQRMSQLGTETAFEVLAKAKALEAQGKSIIHLHIGAPDFRTPEHIVEAGRKALKDGYHSYTPAKGIPELREAVCEDIAKYRKVAVRPENVLIVPGGKPTMFFAIMMFGEPGTEILYPNPGFPIYESVIKFSGAKPVPIELEEAHGFSFSADKVLAKINDKTRLLILNTPANPTGGVEPRSELDAQAERLQINTNSCTNAATQVAGIEALRGPQDAVERMRLAFDERRKIIVDELNQIPGFRCTMPKGAFYALPNTSGTGISSRELEHRFLNDAGVASISGTSFGHLGEGYMRFSYANSIDNIREGLRRVRQCLQPA